MHFNVAHDREQLYILILIPDYLPCHYIYILLYGWQRLLTVPTVKMCNLLEFKDKREILLTKLLTYFFFSIKNDFFIQTNKHFWVHGLHKKTYNIYFI